MTRYKIQKYRCCLVRDGQVSVPVTDGRLLSSESAARVFGALAERADREHMWVVYLNSALAITGVEEVARGGQDGLAITPLDILRGVVVHGARSFILGHNHPSEDVTPSEADVSTTRALAAAAQVVGLDLLDHLVVNRKGGYASLADRGLLAPSRVG